MSKQNIHHSIPVDTLPAIVRVLEHAQDSIAAITGLNIKLVINVVGEATTNTDMLWLMLQQKVCELYGVKWKEVCSPSGKQPLPMVRKLYCYFGKRHIGGRTHMQIAHDLGYINHTSVTCAIAEFSKLIDIKDAQATEHLGKLLLTFQNTYHHES